MTFIEINKKAMEDELQKLEDLLIQKPVSKSFVKTQMRAQMKVLRWIISGASVKESPSMEYRE